MTGTVLSLTDVEDRLSEAMVGAIAARAGFAVARPDLDRDGIDVIIQAGDGVRPRIEAQIKGTINADIKKGKLTFPLKRRNYDLLRGPTQTPRILILVTLDHSEARWLSATPKQLSIRKCAYWVSLRDAPETQNASTVTITIPTKNILTVKSLVALMEKSRHGVVL